MQETTKRFDIDIDIDRPAEVVWALVTDLARTPEWRTTIRSIEPPTELVVGAAFAATTRLFGRTWQWQLGVIEVEPPRRFAYVVTRGVAAPMVEYTLEPRDDQGTRFTMSGRIDQMGLLARLLVPVALPALRRETRTHLAQLKTLLESS